MNDIDYIEIITFNMFERNRIDIDTKKLKVIINNKLKAISNEKIKELQKIINYWNKNYQAPILDAEKFTIRIISNNQIIKVYQGNGSYPNNYNDFKRWIRDIK